MPTGYTAALAEGKPQTFREFALQAARGMGALIMMRDEPWDAPVPQRFEPRTEYHDKAIREAREELERISTMTADEVVAAGEAAAAKAAESSKKLAEKKQAQKARYQAMLAEVVQWSPPDILASFRDFMIEQLQESIKFDCGDTPSYSEPILPGVDWLASKRHALAQTIAYHQKARAEEVARTAERNEWLAALHNSLPAPLPA